LCIVEALRATFDSQFHTDENRPWPRTIDIEYAEKEEDWPFILVQLRIDNVSWLAVNPDDFTLADPPDPTTPWRSVRQGDFSGRCDLQIMALTSAERDRMWDHLVTLFLMGRKKQVTKDFYDVIEAHDLIDMTVQEGTLDPIGDTIGQGTPWSPEALTYEATLGFELIGQFYADEFTENLLSLDQVVTHEYTPQETPYGEADGEGDWQNYAGEPDTPPEQVDETVGGWH
jgi:hypothetical protein